MADACRSCGAEVVWAVRPNGKRIPLDARAITGPIYSLTSQEDLEHGIVLLAKKHPTPRGKVYRSHFETCPDAKDWSKGATPQAGEMDTSDGLGS